MERKQDIWGGEDIHRGILEKLLIHNLKTNGLKALIFAYGLSTSRYIEYSTAVKFLSKASLLLEVGCGHSILPTFWEALGLQVIAADLSLKALKWQKSKTKSLEVICCNAQYQPFREESIAAISCISAIEHLPKEGDIELAREIGRILKKGGFAMISLPLSSSEKDYHTKDPARGVPSPLRRVFGKFLPTFFKMFNVDRGNFYFERHYAFEGVDSRIILPSNCELADSATLRSKKIVKTIHDKIFPQGTLTFLEYFFARTFMNVRKTATNMDALILKLVKITSTHSPSTPFLDSKNLEKPRLVLHQCKNFHLQ